MGGTINVESEYKKGTKFIMLVNVQVKNNINTSDHPVRRLQSKELSDKAVVNNTQSFSF